MINNPSSDPIGQSHSRFTPRVLWLILGLIWLPFLGALPASAVITAADVTIPQQLGAVQNRAGGVAGQPFIFVIGEEHVSLEIQQAVANLLRYLSGAYDVKLVCTEGYDKPLTILRQGTPLVAQRFIARADLAAKRISGVEYFAHAYPEVSVVGVENMRAYEQHGKQLDKRGGLVQEAKQWDEDFEKFLEDLENLEITDKDAERLEATLKKLDEEGDFGPFTEAVYKVAGRESAVGKKLTTLAKRRQAFEESAKAWTADSPEMQARDQSMITATLRTIKDKKVDRAVLVVGKAHLDGIERRLGAQKIPYVGIVPAGVEERSKDEPDNEDERIYEEWRQGKRTGIENWLARLKPLPASARSTFRDRTALLGILATADHLSMQGLPESEVLRVIKQSPLPNRVSIDRVFAINGGQGIEFTANGEKGYAYFADNAEQLTIPGGPKPLEIGQGGGRYYAVYGGGGSNKPPISPRGGSGGDPNEPRMPRRGDGDGGDGTPPDFSTGGFHNDYRRAIVEQKRKQPERVTIWFAIEGSVVVRWVDDGPKMVLAVTPSEVENLRKYYANAPWGPEKVFAAQQLADALLVDLNNQFPQGRIELIQISENNLIGDISLPLVQELARNTDASALENIEKARTYTIDWKDAQKALSSKLGDSIKDEELANKGRARDTIRSETKDTPLKEVFSRRLNEVTKVKLTPAVEKLAYATRFKE